MTSNKWENLKKNDLFYRKQIAYSIWQTTWKCLGSKWNQAWHKAESLQSCGAANTYMHVRPGQCTNAVCQTTSPFPLKLPEKRWQDKISDTEFLKRAGMQSAYIFLSLHGLDGLAMSQECLMSGYQRKYSMENFRWESASKVVRRNATKTP